MRRPFILISLVSAVALSLWGCGGFTGATTSTITGTVLDRDGVAVTNARVWTSDSSTVTSTSGAFVLTAIRAGEVKVNAEISRNGVSYRGVNWTLTYVNEQTQSVNIVVGPTQTSATVVGRVRDREGFVLENVSVWAFNEVGGSVRAFTNAEGDFRLDYLQEGFLYTISATGYYYASDMEDIILSAKETRNLDFVLGNPIVPDLVAPQNFWVQTWVSPTDPTRAPSSGDRFAEARKTYGRGELAEPTSDETLSRLPLRDDIIVESDLYWDYVIDPNVLGYAIYRGLGNTTFLDFLDFSPDPLSGSFVDIGMNAGSVYTYAATSLATLFPDYADTESPISSLYVAETLEKLVIQSPTYFPLRFHWFAGSRADDFSVFLFEEFPGVEVSSIWNDFDTPTFGLSKTYDGPALQSGRRYWYYVVGTANELDSINISQVDSFIAP